MSQVYAAFYRGRAERFFSLARLSDWLTRLITRGPYSHCELAVQQPDGQYICYSASVRDTGVRRKIMPLPPEKWDIIPVNASPLALEAFFHLHDDKGYDWPGALGFVLLNQGRADRLFCSEFCAEFLRLRDSWRWSPNLLYALVTSRETISHDNTPDYSVDRR